MEIILWWIKRATKIKGCRLRLRIESYLRKGLQKDEVSSSFVPSASIEEPMIADLWTWKGMIDTDQCMIETPTSDFMI